MRQLFGALAVSCSLAIVSSARAADCGSLTGRRAASGVVVAAQHFAAEEKIGADPHPWAAPRAFCRVRARLTPAAGSDIEVEIWLPDAAAGTDMGHETPFGTITARWAYGHPQKLIDWDYRAIHLTTLFAKEMIRAYYGGAPQRSYFQGCSDGGREAHGRNGHVGRALAAPATLRASCAPRLMGRVLACDSR